MSSNSNSCLFKGIFGELDVSGPESVFFVVLAGSNWCNIMKNGMLFFAGGSWATLYIYIYMYVFIYLFIFIFIFQGLTACG